MIQEPIRLTPQMSSRKIQALDFIRAYIDRHGVSPTLSEIGAGIGHHTRQRAYELVTALVRDGHVSRVKGRARSIILLDPTRQISTEEAAAKLRDAGWWVAEPLGPLTDSRLTLLPQLDHIPDVEIGVGDDGDRERR